MSGALKTVGKVAGVVALVASLATPFAPATIAATLATVASVATAVSAVATTGSAILQNGPDAIGQVNDRIIGSNNPQPYIMGRSYSGGIQVHDVGYGGTVDDVENPYRFIATVHSCCGPVESLESVQFDFSAIAFDGSENAVGYYANYAYRRTQLGARPEAAALPGAAGTVPDWGSSYKLSGFAAIAMTLIWSKKGKRFAGGQLPAIGAIWEGVKVYDPRLDTTYPGGSGAHRITDESTWTYSRNPALHALAYAYGRYVNGVKVFGADLGTEAIDVADIVAWANVCDTNGWTVNGTIYEPGDKWNNLKRICEAGGGMPVMRGGTLGFHWQAARTSLATVTLDDLADGGVTSRLSKGWKNRHNTLVPRFRSEAHQWNYTQADAVSVPAWITADGEEKTDEKQWDLVTDADQVTELATYELYQRREAGPIGLTCKSHMRDYGPGDCLTLAAELGAHPLGEIKAIVRSRSIDPNSGNVTFEFEQETDAKHAAALGLTGGTTVAYTPPTAEDLDNAYFQNDLSSTPQIIGSPSSNVQAKTSGEAADGELPFSNTYKLLFQGEDRTADATWSVAAVGSGITVSNTLGVVTVTAVDSNSAAYKVSATINGIPTEFIHQVGKRIAAVDINTGTGGTSATDNSFDSITLNTFVPVSDTLNISTGTSGSVELTAPLTVRADSAAPEGSYGAILRWQQDISGVWTDVGSEATGTDSIVDSFGGGTTVSNGYVSATVSLSLTASTSYSFRLTAKTDALDEAADSETRFLTGTASASGT